MKSRFVLYAFGILLIAVGFTVPFLRDEADVERPVEAAPVDEIEPWACPSGQPVRVTCGYVEVPFDYAQPDGPTARLYFARLAPAGAATGVPIAVIGTSLGRPTVVDLAKWHDVSRESGREVVLVDLRGSGLSQPALTCRELVAERWLEADLLGPALSAARESRAASVAACRKRIAKVADTSTFTLDAIVADIDSVRDGLGIETWTLLAGGDASLVARLVADRSTEHVTSLVLLGATARTGVVREQPVEYADEALTAVLTDAGVARLDDIVAPLAERSLVFAVTADGATRQVTVSNETVHSTFAVAAADETLRPELAGLVDALADGQWRSLAILRSQVYPVDREYALGTAAALACANYSGSQKPFWAAADFERVEFIGLADDPMLDPLVCKGWGVDSADVVDLGAPTVPTLVVNGAFDLHAPASATAEVVLAWPDATAITVQRGAPSPFDPCVAEMIGAFLSDTTASIDGSC